MKSRKMVLRNLFVGEHGDADTVKRLVDTAGKENGGQTGRVAQKQMHHQR